MSESQKKLFKSSGSGTRQCWGSASHPDAVIAIAAMRKWLDSSTEKLKEEQVREIICKTIFVSEKNFRDIVLEAFTKEERVDRIDKKQVWRGPWEPDAVQARQLVTQWFDQTDGEQLTEKELCEKISKTVYCSEGNFKKYVLSFFDDRREGRIVLRSKINPPQRKPSVKKTTIKRFIEQLNELEERIAELTERVAMLEVAAIQEVAK